MNQDNQHDINRQAWLRSLRVGDPVKVHIKNQTPFDSVVLNVNGGIIEVQNAGTKTMVRSGKRQNGRFSKIHGHRNSHSPYAQYWETDYIGPILLNDINPIQPSSPSLVEPIQGEQGQIIGFKINNVPFSKLEAEAIYQELGRFL